MLIRLVRKIQHMLRLHRCRRSGATINSSVYIDKYFCIRGSGLTIDSGTTIMKNAWIVASTITGEKNPECIIGKNCSIGMDNEIYATKSIVIEDNVLTAARCYISDNMHGYTDINVPVKDQPQQQIGTVRIGEGSWLGAGVAVLGCNIGRHCVIGANAVVNRDIPDYSVAVGIPARVVKRYNATTGRWERTAPDGSFLV